MTTTTQTQADVLLDRLAQLGVESRLIEQIDAPQVRRFLIEPVSPKSRMMHYTRLKMAEDLAYELGVSHVSISAPAIGRRAIAVEVPREDRQTVTLDDLERPTLDDVYPLRVPVGTAVNGEITWLPIAKAPHCLVAGQTGSGKSSLLHTIIAQCCRNYPPGSLDLVLIDLKRTELTCWDDDPHLVEPVAVDAREALRQLRGVVACMENRYRALQNLGVKDVHEANERMAPYDKCMSYIVLCIDEWAMLQAVGHKEAEPLLVRLAQEGRAAGIHVIVATQYPLREVLPGMLRVNLPTKLALAVTDKTASRLVLDRNGAETLLGRGDGLLSLDGMAPIRFQSAQTTQEEIDEIKEMWR